MKALILTEYQSNLSAMLKGLKVEEIETPKPTGNQILVKIDGSPCNPSDIAFMRGMYNIKKSLPKVAGFEGTGIVVETGDNPEAKHLLGKRVSTFSQQNENGTWSEYFLTKANNCILLKDEMPAEQAACFFVNPFTAYGLFERAQKRGDKAIIQNAAAGVVGAFVHKLAEKERIPLINIVRRPAHVDLLKSQGAEFVLNLRDKEFESQFKELAHKLKATIAFDAVGGEHSGQLLNNMPSNSKVLLYGGLSGQNASNFDILGTIFHKKSFEGFNLDDWMRETKPEHFNEVSNFLQDLIINKEVETKIQKVIKLEDAFDGLYQYVTKMSDGKVIFNPSII